MKLIQMLPINISAYISMHEGMEAYKTCPALKRFVFKYIRTLRNLKRVGPRAAHLLDDNVPPPPLETDEPDFDEQELVDRLLTTEDAEEQVEILATMRQVGFRPPTRGQGGPRRFVPCSGAPARTGPVRRQHRKNTKIIQSKIGIWMVKKNNIYLRRYVNFVTIPS